MSKTPPEMAGQILSAATRLFAQQGYSGTSLQEVADAVGIRKQSLLYHFPNKEALRSGVMDSMLLPWRELVPAALRQSQSGTVRFEATIRVFMDFLLEDRNRAHLLVREALDRPEEMNVLLHAQLAPWMGFVTRFIRLGQESGEVYPDLDPESYLVLSAVLVICVVAGAGVLHGAFPEEDSRERTSRRLVEELLRFTQTALFYPPDKPAGEDSAAPVQPEEGK